MQEVQLYISGQKVELFNDETISLTQTIQNVRDIEKIFTDFTKQFNLPATKSNNKIFKHYYNYDIENGFDARKKVSALIKLNGIDFKKGYIKLNNVELKDNVPNSYKINFIGELAKLENDFKNDKLSDLTSLSAYDTDYNSISVRTKLQVNPNSNNLICPLISVKEQLYYDSVNYVEGSRNLYYLAARIQGVKHTDLKFAMRVDTIIQAIESKYNITFSNDFFNATNDIYYKLFVWLTRKTGEFSNGDQVELLKTKVNEWSTTTPNSNGYMSATDTLTLAPNANRETVGLRTTTLSANPYDIIIKRDGVIVESQRNIIGNNFLFLSDISAGTLKVEVVSAFSSINFSAMKWEITSTPIDDYIFDTGAFFTTDSTEYIITEKTPDIKVIDFLTGIFKMFNLVSYVKDNGDIYVDTLDNYYKLGSTRDITKYVDVNLYNSEPTIQYDQINLSYEDTKTYAADLHSQSFGELWGGAEYNNNEKLNGSTYEIKVPFSHMKFERLLDLSSAIYSPTTIQWGYSANNSKSEYVGKPLLFYPYLQTGTSISYMLDDVNKSELTSYIIPSNSVDINSTISKKNINFDNEINEYEGSVSFNETLFELYHKNYIIDLFNSKNRIITLTANLPLSILLNYSLADIFVVNKKKYKINSVVTNLQTGESKLELISDFTIEDLISPSVPTGIIISNETADSFTVSWTASTDNVAVLNYDIYIDDVYYATTSLTMYDIEGLTSSTTYGVKILARDTSNNESALSAAVNGTTTTPDVTPPSIPTNLAVSQPTYTKADLTLTWTASTDDVAVLKYEVWRSVAAGAYFKIASPTSAGYVDKTVSYDINYCYKVLAVDTSLNESGFSSIVCKTPLDTPPT